MPYDVLNAAELGRRFPVLRPRPDDTAVYEVRAGFLRPEGALRSYLELAARYGANLRFEDKVETRTANTTGEGVRVVTDKGSYQAAALVVAPGAWAPEMLSGLRIPFEVQRRVVCWFEPEPSVELFLPVRFPIYI